MTSRIVCDVERLGPWVCERTGATYVPGSSTGIGLERGGSLVAGVLFDQFTGGSVCMHVASDGTRAWMTREYLGYCFAYPFRQLGVKKIIGLVDSTNERALAFDKALGFKVEHVIEDAGKTGSLVILSMSRKDCRWLDIGERYGFQWAARRAA